jgi:hypothetical protein
MNQTIEGKNKDLVLTEATRIRGQQPFRGRVQVGAENNGRTIARSGGDSRLAAPCPRWLVLWRIHYLPGETRTGAILRSHLMRLGTVASIRPGVAEIRRGETY